jgi:hypothetical protein
LDLLVHAKHKDDPAGTMALRILVEVLVVNPVLLKLLLPSISLLAEVPLVATVAIANWQNFSRDWV